MLRDKLKFALGQIEVIPGRPDLNTAKIIAEIKAARDRGVKIIAFPEMAVPGYLLGDEWENDALMTDLMTRNEQIREATAGIVAIWGNVFLDPFLKGEDGRQRKYNAAYIAQDKQWVSNGVFLGQTYKTLMPKYREFDDERHFFSMLKLSNETGVPLSELLKPFAVKVDGQTVKVGITLCEDMWSDDYHDKPIKILVDNGADLIVNISCSPWTWKKNDKRHRVVKSQLETSPIPFVYVNNTGIQNNGKNIFLFDGSSTVYNHDGSIRAELGGYEEKTFDVTVDGGISVQTDKVADPDQDTKELYEGLIYGIKKFMAGAGKKNAVIGISGGIDSAVVATLMTLALGAEHVFGVNMPSKFNSDLTKNAAAKLAKNLGIKYVIVPIQESVDLTISQLQDVQKEIPVTIDDLVVQNIQARDRGSRILAAIVASILEAILTNNGNKVEVALGYATLYGDIDGAIAPIGDIYKGEVYTLAKYINKINGRELIPEEIISVVPSAELSASQDVTKGLGDPMIYPYHDKLIRAFVEFRMDPEKILELYLNSKLEKELKIELGLTAKCFPTAAEFIADLEDKWRKYKIAVFKRIQAPPIIAVSRRAFGFDLRETQLQSSAYFTQKYQELKADALKQ